MKSYIILFSFLAFCLNVNAQNSDLPFSKSELSIDEISRKITFMEIDTIPGISSEVIFSKALEWIAVNFRDANNVIKLQDRVGGKIVVKGYSKETYNFKYLWEDQIIPYNQWFTINITVKDSKYRIVFTDYYIQSIGKSSPTDFIKSIETPLEASLNSIPDQYDFEKMKRHEKFQMYVQKQVLSNAKNQAMNDIASMKYFIRKNNIQFIRQDDNF